MISSHHMEDIHISYISALCASAGISYDTQRHDDDSTDGIIKKRIDKQGALVDVFLRIQLKSTSSSSLYKDQGDVIKYILKVKNYNDLCRKATIPVILGLLILPENEDQWVQCNLEELLIKGRMYWADLSASPESDNASTVTVEIPKTNIVNKEFLLEALSKIARDEWPS